MERLYVYPQNAAQGGPVFRARRDITTHDLVLVCRDAIRELNLDGADEYHVRVEPISEGGLELTRFPGKKPGMLKTMRFGGPDPFPWVPDPQDEWLQQPQIELVQRDKQLWTMLKAYFWAPLWTSAEVRAICRAFDRHGMTWVGVPRWFYTPPSEEFLLMMGAAPRLLRFRFLFLACALCFDDDSTLGQLAMRRGGFNEGLLLRVFQMLPRDWFD